MSAVFVDCTDDLLKLWQQVLRPDDPQIAINMDKARSVDVPRVIARHDTLINDHTQFDAGLLERCHGVGLRHIVFLGTGAASYMNVAELEGRGHLVNQWPDWHEYAGHAHGITVDSESGILVGGSDPRSDGAAIGY